MKSRIIIIFLFSSSIWCLLLVRAFVIQVLPNDKLTQRQQKLFQTQIQVQGRRGTIYDRNGEELAISVSAYSIFADPTLIKKPKEVAQVLSQELKVNYSEILNKLLINQTLNKLSNITSNQNNKQKDKKFVWLKRRVDTEKIDKIKKLKFAGIGFIEEPKRIYLSDDLFAPIIGTTNQEGLGAEGVEKQFDSILKPNTEKVTVKRDARGRPLQVNGLLVTESHDGQDLYLSLDREIQFRLNKELKNTIESHEADSAYGVVLDAQTSEVVAMTAVSRDFAQKAFSEIENPYRNKSLIESFEPGSTLKTFVIAEAIARAQIQANTRIFCENGKMRVGKNTIREADSHHQFTYLSTSEILSLSSNIGAAKIGFQLGAENLREALLKFGFGLKTGIELPGESSGILQNLPWSKHLLSNISFGHGVSTTPLQIANAYASIANGGLLKRPTVIKNGNSIEKIPWWNSIINKKNKSELVKRVLTPEQANVIKLMLMGVTAPGGTGVNARVSGYIVAGKTGTAQKVNPNGLGYVKGAYISSFAGFIPADNPRYVIYVAVDTPKKDYYGSQVAAPLFANVSTFLMQKEGIVPTVLHENAFNISSTFPNDLKNENKINSENKEQLINEQSNLDLNIQEITTDEDLVPDLRNLNLREVQLEIGRLKDSKNLDLKIIGNGNMVEEMDPQPNQPWPKKDRKVKIKMR